MHRRTALLLALALLTFGGVQTAAAADTFQSVTFSCTGFPQELTVPPGVTQMTVSVRGAAGGGDLGGVGADTAAFMDVTPGAVLRVTVGCRDGYGLTRGGAAGKDDTNSSVFFGGNGGGSSGIVDEAAASTPLIVASGGGGEGGAGFFWSSVSGGSAPDGNGSDGGGDNPGGAGQGGASSTPAGEDGHPSSCLGGGGGGGGGGYPHGGSGGGGGGCGGSSGGGGGAGSSFAGPSVSGASFTPATAVGDGEVTLSYIGPDGTPKLYQCTGAAQSYTVPDGVTSLLVVAAGGAGGEGPRSVAEAGPGGQGAVRRVTVDVTPGTTYKVAAGCKGGKGEASQAFSDGGGGDGGFGIIRGGKAGYATADGLAGAGGAGGGGGGGASGIATAYPLTAGSLVLATAGGGGGGGAGRYTDGGHGGDADVDNATGNTGCCGGAPGGLGAVGGSEVSAVGGGARSSAFGTSGGGGGGGGGGLQGGGGGFDGHYLGGGGGGGAGGRTALTSAVHLRSADAWKDVLGSGNGAVLIAPVWSKTPTTTTVTVPVNPVYDGTAKTASATTVDNANTVIAHPTVTYTPGPGAPVNAGDYTASASYAGDDTHEGSSDSKPFTIAKAPSVTKVTVAGATYDGSPHGATAKVTGAGGLDQALTVTYAGRGSTTYGPSSTAPTNAGDYTASASYPGDTNHNNSADSADYTIGKAPSTTKVTVAGATYDGDPQGATAKVTGAGGLDQALDVTYKGRGGTTYGPSGTAPTNAGDYTASASYGGDANHSGSDDTEDYTIAKAPLTITADNKTQQYSDPRPALTITYSGFVKLEGPSALTGATTCSTTVTTVGGNVTSPAGDYPITCSGQTGANYAVKYVAGTFTVTRENATIEYTGDTLDMLGSTASTTSVKLAAAIREAADGTIGDKLGTTSLKFTVYKSSDATLSTPVASCTAAVTATGSGAGAGSCSVSLGEDNYVVEIQLVTNGYYTAPIENGAITVVTPGTGRTTGGGWLTEPTLKTRSNFGFTVKYLKNGSIQGNSLYISRRTVAANTVANPSGGYLPAGEYNWIVKSNAMSALTQKCSTATPKVCTATFTGKANITAVNRSTGSAYSLGGNYQFQVDVTDNGEPGSSNTPAPDTYALRVWNSGGTYYQLGAPNAQLKIEGGNIQVRP